MCQSAGVVAAFLLSLPRQESLLHEIDYAVISESGTDPFRNLAFTGTFPQSRSQMPNSVSASYITSDSDRDISQVSTHIIQDVVVGSMYDIPCQFPSEAYVRGMPDLSRRTLQ